MFRFNVRSIVLAFSYMSAFPSAARELDAALTAPGNKARGWVFRALPLSRHDLQPLDAYFTWLAVSGGMVHQP
jgi:hypothetical protein